MARVAVALLVALMASAAEPSYRVYRGDGSPATLDQIAEAATAAEVLFLGETHDDPTAHALQSDLFKRMHAIGPVALTMEMFERDVQYVVNEYLASQIGEDHLLASGRAWRAYKTDYRPLVEFAKENRIPVVAGNAPRRYVNRVGRLGRESLAELSDSAKGSLPPLPYAEASADYAKRFHDVMAKVRVENPDRKPDPVKQLAAQSLWDASMAFSIAETMMRFPRARIVQLNGSFHSEYRQGILDHLAVYRPGTKSVVVTMAPHKSFPEWNAELANKGDFVIVTDAKLTRSAAEKK